MYLLTEETEEERQARYKQAWMIVETLDGGGEFHKWSMFSSEERAQIRAEANLYNLE